MQSTFLLDVVIRQSTTIFELLTSEDEALLVWWDAFLVLDLGLDVLDGVSCLDIKGDGLASEGLDEDLHTTKKSKHQVESGLLLDVVVGKSSSIFKLFTSEDESLLIRWDSFLVLDLSLDVLDRVGRLDLEGDGLASKGLHKDLHVCLSKRELVLPL